MLQLGLELAIDPRENFVHSDYLKLYPASGLSAQCIKAKLDLVHILLQVLTVMVSEFQLYQRLQ